MPALGQGRGSVHFAHQISWSLAAGGGRAPDKMHRAAGFLSEKSPIATTRWHYSISLRASQQQIRPELARGEKETNETFSALNDSH